MYFDNKFRFLIVHFRSNHLTCGRCRQVKAFFLKLSLEKIFEDRMPLAIIKAYAPLKKAYATVNENYGLKRTIATPIKEACDEVVRGDFDDEFSLNILQASAAAEINIRINEILSNRVAQILLVKQGQAVFLMTECALYSKVRENSDFFAHSVSTLTKKTKCVLRTPKFQNTLHPKEFLYASFLSYQMKSSFSELR